MVVDDLHRNTTAGQRWLPRLYLRLKEGRPGSARETRNKNVKQTYCSVVNAHFVRRELHSFLGDKMAK